MFRKSALIAILTLGLIGGLFFLYRHIWFASKVRNSTNQELPQILDKDTAATSHLPESPMPSGSRVHLHPLSDATKLAEAKEQSVKTWDEWLDATVEVLLAEAILYGKVEASTLSISWIEDTPEGVAENRDWLPEVLTQHIKHHKSWLKSPRNTQETWHQSPNWVSIRGLTRLHRHLSSPNWKLLRIYGHSYFSCNPLAIFGILSRVEQACTDIDLK